MNRPIVVAALLAFAGLAAGPVHAQFQTEQFIPIGKSPGVSGKYSVIGEISAVDEDAGTITVVNAEGSHTLKVDDKTIVWIDRSSAKRKNVEGGREDCRVGRRVEVMHIWNDRSVARWVKIEG